MVRKPVVAGQFYPGSRDALLKMVESLVDKTAAEKDAIGALCPHAGYIYSGRVAGRVLSYIKPKSSYIIIGPNHTGLGVPFGTDTSDSWATPLGEVKLHKRLSELILKNCRYIKKDSLSCSAEHSLEVQLPFLQCLNKNFKIVPIVATDAVPDVYREIAAAIVKSVKEMKLEKDVVIIASSDMTHYEPDETARKKDASAIEAILELNEDKLLEVVSDLNISMCGLAPSAIMISASKLLGAKKTALVKYETSAASSGDFSSVVGYAGIAVY